MPAGDVQRVWFPEMLDELKTFWSQKTTWDDWPDFCQRMTEKRKEIRLARGIKPPRTGPLPLGARCLKCGRVSEKTSKPDPLAVSIRSALFALKKGGLIRQAEFVKLDASWMRHKATNGLDAYGRKMKAASDK